MLGVLVIVVALLLLVRVRPSARRPFKKNRDNRFEALVNGRRNQFRLFPDC